MKDGTQYWGKRIVAYVRVSTVEQKLNGLSVEAQTAALQDWAKENGVKILKFYNDAGFSARKPYNKRPAMVRLLEDVREKKIDLIVFTRLDRWFRSLAEYYKVQEVLEKYKVDWQTIQEDYDTSTTSGRLKINIMLSVAQDEADRTSDRIKLIFAHKVEQGEVISGKVPLGFKIENKHLVHDPEKVEMVRELFLHYAKHGSKHGAVQHIFDTYGVKIDRHSFQQMLRNTLYKGERQGVPFCEPIIDPDLFDRLNAMPNIKVAPSRRIYIFSGLVVCAECGSRMSGRHSYNSNGNEYMYYRCNRYSNFGDCSNDRLANEQAIEQWLLDHVEEEANKRLVEYKAEAAVKRKKPEIDRAAIKRKLSHLKELYVNEMIDLEEYRKDYEAYTAQLAENPEPEEPKLNAEGLKKFLESDLHSIYQGLDREQRRTLWRGIIREIRVDSQKHITICFG